MSLASDLYTFLSTRSPQLSTDIYPLKLPDDHSSWPAITYTIDEDENINLLSGGVSSTEIARVSIDVFAPYTSYTSAQNTADAVETALVGYSGAFGTDSVEQIWKERRFDLYEPDTKLSHVSMQYLIYYG